MIWRMMRLKLRLRNVSKSMIVRAAKQNSLSPEEFLRKITKLVVDKVKDIDIDKLPSYSNDNDGEIFIVKSAKKNKRRKKRDNRKKKMLL